MKILIELPTWLGDCIMATPAITNICQHFPKSRITFIGSRTSIEVLDNFPNMENTLVLSKKLYEDVSRIRQLGNFDYYFSFRSTFRSSFYKFFCKSKNKFIYNPKTLKRFKHQVEKYNAFVNFSIQTSYPPGKLYLPGIATRGTEKNKKIIGLNPGAKYGSAKRWDILNFQQLMDLLPLDFTVHIFGSEEEKIIAESIYKYAQKRSLRCKNFAGRTSISELKSLISELACFVTSDSGPMHIAAALEVPTVAIFGPTNLNETSPWKNKNGLLLRLNLECQPCMRRTCPLGHNKCMVEIKPEMVYEAISKLLTVKE